MPSKLSAPPVLTATATRAKKKSPVRSRGKKPTGETVAAILDALDAAHPNVTTMLDFTNAFELLVATILSAQCTDKRVNIVTPALFAAYPTAAAMQHATPEDLYPYINTCGLYRNKARHLVGMATALVERHNGDVPHDRDALESLPGVGRKTASVVLANAFGEPEIAVDTHVGRVARRLGLTRNTDPTKVEFDLQALIPEARRAHTHHTLIWHGRLTCKARNPACDACTLTPLCPKIGVA